MFTPSASMASALPDLLLHAAPAVLADLAARGGNDKGGAGGDIEGVGAIAAGADDIDQMGFVVHVHLVGKLAHHLARRPRFRQSFPSSRAGR